MFSEEQAKQALCALIIVFIIVLIWSSYSDFSKNNSILGCGCETVCSCQDNMTGAIAPSSASAGIDQYKARDETGPVSDSADYSGDVIQSMSLEPGVIESHNRFIKDVHHRTTGASAETVRDDSNDVVPWIGLRRPKYNAGAFATSGARVEHSESPEQMPQYTPFCI
jgi:hypothetical protein